ncbi:MAG: hypothetical protein GY791_04605 [Alphaproteobacteria bacterium]|nr:hypothetical protein [Alphaproteobacteria bacterium]
MGDGYALGKDSIAMFRDMFAALFENAVELPGTSLAPSDHPGIDAIIAPRISNFEHYLGAYEVSIFERPPFVAKITYEFDLFSRDGARIDKLIAHGRGQEYQGQIGVATKAAMENAALEFAQKFHQFAEGRWGPGAFPYATAAVAARVLKPADLPEGFGPAAVAGVLENFVSVVVDPYLETDRQAAEFPGLDLRRSQVVPIRVHMRNYGPGILETHRSRIVARLDDGTQVEQLDEHELSALLAPYYGGSFPHVPAGPGLAMVPFLFMGLLDAARRQEAIDTGEAATRVLDASAFEVAKLEPSEIADGFVYFHRGGFDGPILDATLIVPVADVETKTVYTMEIPLRGPAQEFTPYRMN